MRAPKWDMTRAESEWRCEWHGHRLAVRKINAAAYDGYINGECVMRGRSLERAHARLVTEIERNGGQWE